METLPDTLVERVDKLVHPSTPLEWGNPLLSTTPIPMAIHELAAQNQALAIAVQELAIAVQEIAVEVQKLARQD